MLNRISPLVSRQHIFTPPAQTEISTKPELLRVQDLHKKEPPELLKVLGQITKDDQGLTMYYPACGEDFFEPHLLPQAISTIIYLDNNQNSLNVLKKNRIGNLHCADAKGFKYMGKDKFADIVLLSNNHGFTLTDIYEQINENGYVIADNVWNSNASDIYLQQIPGLELQAVWFTKDDGSLIKIDPQNLTWKPKPRINSITLSAFATIDGTETNIDRGFFVYKKSAQEYQPIKSYHPKTSIYNMLPSLMHFSVTENDALVNLYTNPSSTNIETKPKIVGHHGKEFVLSREEIENLYSNIPSTIRDLSELNQISFQFTDKVFVPNFNDDGTQNKQKPVVLIANNDFPNTEIHPSKFYVGLYSSPDNSENTIYMSAIPDNISDINFDKDTRKKYQAYVFLHEFFHSVINQFIDDDEKAKQKILSTSDTESYSMYQWIEDAKKIIHENPDAFTQYLKIHENDLSTSFDNSPEYKLALKEYLCEAFALYMGVDLPAPSRTYDDEKLDSKLKAHFEKLNLRTKKPFGFLLHFFKSFNFKKSL